MEALPKNVTAGLHFQSLPEYIKGKMQRNSHIDFGKKAGNICKAVLKLH